jgi:hypothetical protein
MSHMGTKVSGRMHMGHIISLPKEEEWLEVCQLTMVEWFHTNVVWMYVKTNVGWV